MITFPYFLIYLCFSFQSVVSRGPVSTGFSGSLQDFQHSNALLGSLDLQPDSLITGINSSASVDLTKCYASVSQTVAFLHQKLLCKLKYSHTRTSSIALSEYVRMYGYPTNISTVCFTSTVVVWILNVVLYFIVWLFLLRSLNLFVSFVYSFFTLIKIAYLPSIL